MNTVAWTRRRIQEADSEIVHLTAELDRMKRVRAALVSYVEYKEKEGRTPDEFRRTSAALFSLTDSNVSPDMGIIKAVRAVVHGAGKRRVLPTEIRDTLVESGFPKSGNLLSEIHAALRRLAERKEIAPVRVGKKTAYRSRGARMY